MSHLRQLLARNGVRVGALHDGRVCKLPDDVGRRFGLRPIGAAWCEVARAEAVAILRVLLERDLAYDAELIAPELAAEMASDFVREFPDEAKFFTNARWDGSGELGTRSIGSWMPATESTFDSGIVVLHQDRVGVYWVEDED